MTDPTQAPASSLVTHVRIPLGLLNATLAYLQTKPWAEVDEMVRALKGHGDASVAEQLAVPTPREAGTA